MPDAFDQFYDLLELLQVDPLRNVAVSVQVVARHDNLLRLRAGQIHHWNAPQLFVPLDFGEHLTTALLRQVEVEQNEIWARRSAVGLLTPEECQRRDAVADRVQIVAD